MAKTNFLNNKNLFVIILVSLLLLIILFYRFFLYQKDSNHIIIGDGKNGPQGMVWIPGGKFMMGSRSPLAKNNEKPAHEVKVDGFWIDQTDVTNAQFAKFVKETGYLTTAERKPDWETVRAQLPPGTPKPPDNQLIPGALVFVGTTKQVALNGDPIWWAFVPGANWRHPEGPHSNIVGKENYPVVQVSYEDAMAYAKWSGKRLPTEAEWEYAARGGLAQKDFAWGNQFSPDGKRMANIFAGKEFPVVEPAEKNKIGTTQVKSFPPNGYQLYDMTGNVWQFVADWYRADAFLIESNNTPAINPKGPSASWDPDHDPMDAPERVVRGGSFLCDPNFCMSYRPSARRGVDPYNPMSHIGFRLAMSNHS